MLLYSGTVRREEEGRMDFIIETLSLILEEKIKESIEREIALLRSVLGNLSEEALSLAAGDRKKWNDVMQERYILLEKIKEVRRERGPWESSSPPSSCDILFLTDKLFALLHKLQEEMRQNETPRLPAGEILPAPCKTGKPLPRKKSVLMTLP